jgi:hypothetical protein
VYAAVEVLVPIVNVGTATDPVGATETVAVYVAESAVLGVASVDCVITFVAAAPTVVEAKCGAVLSAVAWLAVRAAAFAGTTDNRPKPIAATVASAMRLKVVFVDICFLSISRDRESPALGFG